MKIISTKKGFTLVEMIVSLAIFSVVALVAVGSLVKVMDANKKSISLKTSINNLNFAFESMTREMRMGSNYSCKNNSLPVSISSSPASQTISASNCSVLDGDWTIAFKSSRTAVDGNTTCRLVSAYRFKSNTLEKAEATSCSDTLLNDSNFAPLISLETKINKAVVDVKSESTTEQPRIRIYIDGESGTKAKTKTQFTLQTSISQRLPI